MESQFDNTAANIEIIGVKPIAQIEEEVNPLVQYNVKILDVDAIDLKELEISPNKKLKNEVKEVQTSPFKS